VNSTAASSRLVQSNNINRSAVTPGCRMWVLMRQLPLRQRYRVTNLHTQGYVQRAAPGSALKVNTHKAMCPVAGAQPHTPPPRSSSASPAHSAPYELRHDSGRHSSARGWQAAGGASVHAAGVCEMHLRLSAHTNHTGNTAQSVHSRLPVEGSCHRGAVGQGPACSRHQEAEAAAWVLACLTEPPRRHCCHRLARHTGVLPVCLPAVKLAHYSKQSPPPATKAPALQRPHCCSFAQAHSNTARTAATLAKHTACKSNVLGTPSMLTLAAVPPYCFYLDRYSNPTVSAVGGGGWWRLTAVARSWRRRLPSAPASALAAATPH
jgi:hypothetical protein